MTSEFLFKPTISVKNIFSEFSVERTTWNLKQKAEWPQKSNKFSEPMSKSKRSSKMNGHEIQKWAIQRSIFMDRPLSYFLTVQFDSLDRSFL